MVTGGQAPIFKVLFVHLGWHLLGFALGAGAAVGAFIFLGEPATLPSMPIAIVGTALSIFLGFRTNAAYGRYWEARTQWGRVISSSRHLGHQALAYLEAGPDTGDAAPWRALLIRQSLYAHVLRCHCRKQDPLEDEHVLRLCEEQDRPALTSTNPPASILRTTLVLLAEAARRGKISPEKLQSFDASLRALLDAQSDCERIRNTPLPVSYTYYARRLVIAYGVMLPWALTADLGPLTLFVAPTVALVFLLIDNAGELIETPFSLTTFGLPLSDLSLTIERNLRELDDPGDIPAPQAPSGPRGNILM